MLRERGGMLKEDLQSLCYHKMNAIIQLEHMEQMESQNELDINSLSAAMA